jgi:NAD dependent epimerase/dehydratase family
MNDALIGYTGFVGSNLCQQHTFGEQFNSRNISEMAGRSYQVVVCAGVQAKKWWANDHPAEDWKGISSLIDVLRQVNAERFVLISTIDVYPRPSGVTESSPIESENHAYGQHRYAFEEFVREKFPVHHVIRLPGLFGTGLKKNVIFDLSHDNCLDQINPAAKFQYYWLKHLWADILRVSDHRLPLLNIATEPIATREIISRFFPHQWPKVGPEKPQPAPYDMRTNYSELWGSDVPGYLYNRRTVLEEIGQFVREAKSRTS